MRGERTNRPERISFSRGEIVLADGERQRRRVGIEAEIVVGERFIAELGIIQLGRACEWCSTGPPAD